MAFELEHEMRLQGAEPAFPTIVAFGPNAAIPHHLTSNKKLAANQCILIDFGARKNNYCSDISRSLFFGTPTDEQIKVYQTVKTAQERAISYLNSEFRVQNSKLKKIHASDVDNKSRQYIIDQGFPAFSYALGHGVGIAFHEAPILSPRSHENLQNGNVFTLEPGIHLSGKMGVRIEDMFAIQNNRLIQLTKPQEMHHIGYLYAP